MQSARTSKINELPRIVPLTSSGLSRRRTVAVISDTNGRMKGMRYGKVQKILLYP